MSQVIACIDGSQSTQAVCDYAAWSSQRLNAPLTFLHVLNHQPYPVKTDLSGSIGLGSREHLLEELAELDAQRGKLALEQGRLMLEAAKQRAIADGVAKPNLRQRHGDLLESLRELQGDTRLLVIGKQGATSDSVSQLMSRHLENVIRTIQRPILITPINFKAPQSLMLAFDNSATSQKGIQMLAASPLFHGLPIHLVMVATDARDNRAQLQSAGDVLTAAGFTVHSAIVAGDVEPALHAYQAEHRIDLLVMGAYGHSRIRQFLLGSTTTSMLRTTRTPLLLLR